MTHGGQQRAAMCHSCPQEAGDSLGQNKMIRLIRWWIVNDAGSLEKKAGMNPGQVIIASLSAHGVALIVLELNSL